MNKTKLASARNIYKYIYKKKNKTKKERKMKMTAMSEGS